jgi:hypothetical protein
MRGLVSTLILFLSGCFHAQVRPSADPARNENPSRPQRASSGGTPSQRRGR